MSSSVLATIKSFFCKIIDISLSFENLSKIGLINFKRFIGIIYF